MNLTPGEAHIIEYATSVSIGLQILWIPAGPSVRLSSGFHIQLLGSGAKRSASAVMTGGNIMRKFVHQGLFLAFVLGCMAGGLSADEKSAADAEKENLVQDDARVGIVEFAVQLIQRGEQTRSPMLLLAAAELLEGAGDIAADTAGIETQQEGGTDQKSDKQPLAISRKGLQARALELAANAEQKELVQEWIDQPRSRGIVYSQGKDLPSVTLKGVEYRVLENGVLNHSQSQTFRNARFEGQKTARVLVIGDGDGDLDLWVYDQNTDSLIGKDTDSTSICEVVWTPRYTGPFRIRVANVGQIAERYLVLVNW